MFVCFSFIYMNSFVLKMKSVKYLKRHFNCYHHFSNVLTSSSPWYNGQNVHFAVGRRGFNFFIDSNHKILKDGIHSFSSWCLARYDIYREKAGKFVFCFHGFKTKRDFPIFMGHAGSGAEQSLPWLRLNETKAFKQSMSPYA